MLLVMRILSLFIFVPIRLARAQSTEWTRFSRTLLQVEALTEDTPARERENSSCFHFAEGRPVNGMLPEVTNFRKFA